MKEGSRANALLVELLLVIFFFMLGATTLELLKNHDAIASARVGWDEIAIGFVTAFIVAIVVIKWFVGIVSKHGFAPFAWYRIVAGIGAITWLSMR